MDRTVILFLIFWGPAIPFSSAATPFYNPSTVHSWEEGPCFLAHTRRHFMAQRWPSVHAVTSWPEFSRPGPLLKGTPRLTGLRTNSSHPQPRTTALQLVSHSRLIHPLAHSSVSKTFTEALHAAKPRSRRSGHTGDPRRLRRLPLGRKIAFSQGS